MTIERFGLRRQGDYDFPPFRPPSEADSLLLRVTRGCPWNRCSFCSMYKTMKFEIRDIEEVLSDIESAKNCTETGSGPYSSVIQIALSSKPKNWSRS